MYQINIVQYLLHYARLNGVLNAKMVIKLEVKSPAKETRRGCEEQGVCAKGITGSDAQG